MPVDPANLSLEERIDGCLLASAVGDALGAPVECWDYRWIRNYLGDYSTFEEMQHAFDMATGPRPRAWVHPVGHITDDTVLSDLLLDALIDTNGELTAYGFAKWWERFDEPIQITGQKPLVRLDHVHWIEKISYLRNRLLEIDKREIGHGEASATNAIMYAAPIGLACAGDPLLAELMAVDVTAVNQHGASRDVAGGYCAAIAAAFLPNTTLDDLVGVALDHTRHRRHCREMDAMLDLARKCSSTEEYTARYYAEIIGTWIPYRDRQHEESTKSSVTTWINSEILGNALAALVLTGGNASAMMHMCARMGRDCDTMARVAGGLIGAWRGPAVIPPAWTAYVRRANGWFDLDRHLAKGPILAAIVRHRLGNDIARRQSVLFHSLELSK